MDQRKCIEKSKENMDTDLRVKRVSLGSDHTSHPVNTRSNVPEKVSMAHASNDWTIMFRNMYVVCFLK